MTQLTLYLYLVDEAVELELAELQSNPQEYEPLAPREQTFSPFLLLLTDESIRDQECSICFGALDGEEPVSSLKHCGHQFHHECITQWL